MGAFEYTPGRTIVARLSHGTDLLDGLQALAAEHKVAVGSLTAIGALQRASLGYYRQDRQEYRRFAIDGPVEILACVGNVSARDGEAAIHAHLTVGDEQGGTRGGHLMDGCLVFACEVTLTELLGHALTRGYDATTGLPLWSEL